MGKGLCAYVEAICLMACAIVIVGRILRVMRITDILTYSNISEHEDEVCYRGITREIVKMCCELTVVIWTFGEFESKFKNAGYMFGESLFNNDIALRYGSLIAVITVLFILKACVGGIRYINKYGLDWGKERKESNEHL